MGRIEGKFVSGIVGPAVFRKVGNRQLVSAKHGSHQIAMTEASDRASYIFGRASTIARYFRSAARPILRFYDEGMISKFTGKCNRIIQRMNAADSDPIKNYDDFSILNGFEFNQDSQLRRYLFTQPQVILTEDEVVIDFPETEIARDLDFAPYAQYCTIAFKVALFDLDQERRLKQDVQLMEVGCKSDKFTFPAQRLSFKGASGALCLIYVGLLYSERTFAGNAVIYSQQLSPSAILRAEYCPGDAVERVDWSKMTFKPKVKRKRVKKQKADKPQKEEEEDY